MKGMEMAFAQLIISVVALAVTGVVAVYGLKNGDTELALLFSGLAVLFLYTLLKTVQLIRELF